MRIALVSDAVYPYNKGGKEKRLFELSTRLAGLGHDVRIYTMHWWDGPASQKVEHGVTLQAISPKIPMYKGDRRSITEGILFGLYTLKLIFAQFDVLDVDHMPFFPVFSAWIACRLRRKKLFGTWHESLTTREWVSYMGRGGYIASLIESLCIRLPDCIIAASEQTRRRLAHDHHRTKNVLPVASGVNVALIKSSAPVPQPIDVLYVGRLVKDKNVDTLVRAIGIITDKKPNIQCTIIGHGVEETPLKKLISKLKIADNVTIRGPLKDAAQVYGYMKRAKVFVLPSVREGFGIVALEALSCGTPVVTADAPSNAASDLVEEGKTGSIVPLDDNQFAAAILKWLKYPRPAAVTASLQAYDWNELASKLDDIYSGKLSA